MTGAPPRLKLDELFLEIRLTSRRHIIVEGLTDQRFFQAWLHDVETENTVAVTSVEMLDVSADSVLALGLTVGNRGRVVAAAARAVAAEVDLRAVADRDCGHHVSEHLYRTLCWTDYPALESYALDEATLDRANLLSFGGKLPVGADLLAALTPALRDLFAVRVANEHLERPNYKAGIVGGGSLAEFDVAAAIHESLRSAVPDLERPTASDPREFAYGHDIGELIFEANKNLLKNQIGLHLLSAVESALRSAVQAVGTYKEEQLFRNLREWILN